MARAQSQYLRIYNAANTTLYRFQSYYSYRPITWSSATWDYLPFVADGFTAGVTGDESNVTITAPATSTVATVFQDAINSGHFAQLFIYEFNSSAGNLSPQDGQSLVGTMTAQVVGGQATATTMTLQLGTALSPVGAQFPPRKLTTQLMGVGCRL